MSYRTKWTFLPSIYVYMLGLVCFAGGITMSLLSLDRDEPVKAIFFLAFYSPLVVSGLFCLSYRITFREHDFQITHLWRRRFSYNKFQHYSTRHFPGYRGIPSYWTVALWSDEGQRLTLYFMSMDGARDLLNSHWKKDSEAALFRKQLKALAHQLTQQRKQLCQHIEAKEIDAVMEYLEACSSRMKDRKLGPRWFRRPRLKLSRKAWSHFPELKDRLLRLDRIYRWLDV